MSQPDPQHHGGPQGWTQGWTQPVGAFDPATGQAYGPPPPYGPPPHDPQSGQPYGPPPAPAFDPQTGLPLAPPPPPYGPPPGFGPPPAGYGPPPGYGAYPLPRPTNGMAIASLVLGILWIYWIGSILALVFGYLARQQIAERGESGAGLALAGIILGWIGVGALVLMLLFLFVGAAAGAM